MKPHVLLIALIGVMVPRRLRADWREEWAAELRHREQLLADWNRLDARMRWELLRRSAGAFWDALWLQRQRLEDDVVQDLRFGVRMLARNPGSTVVAILTLALGIGTNTAIFSIVNAMLLRPLGGVADPEQLVEIRRVYAGRSTSSDPTYPDFVDYRDRATTLSGVSALVPTAFHVRVRGQTERVEGEFVASNYFDVLGVQAAAGRLIRPTDDVGDAADAVAVVSHRLWRRLFEGDPAAVGSTIAVDGRPFLVVGVASEHFAGARIGTPRDVWVPILSLRRTDPNQAAHLRNRRASWIAMFGRIKPDLTFEQTRSELTTIAARLEREYPETNAKVAVRVDRGFGRDAEVEQSMRRFAYLPSSAAAIVLLISCANVGGLLLARATSRKQEIDTRLALGARRLRIVRQLLTESAVLALMGGLAGLAMGVWLTRWLRSLLPERYLFLAFDVDFGVDWHVFAFMLGVAVFAGMVFGLAPALHASRTDLASTLRASRGDRSGAVAGARRVLVVGQVSLSLALLVAAGLCVRTLQQASAIDTGYDVDRVLTARLDLAKQRYDDVRGRAFQHQLIERLRTAPGIDAAGFAATLPLNDSRWENPVYRTGDPARLQTFHNVVSPGYFDTMKIPLVAGRAFADTDSPDAPRVVIINQRLAQMLWPGESPVGRVVDFDRRPHEVIGLARDIRGRNLFEAPGPMLYQPIAQAYSPTVVLHVRGTLATAALASLVRDEVGVLDRGLPIYSVQMLDEHLRATLTPQRLLAYLISGFGGLALLLTAVGLYGLLSYTVTERTPEIGIRMALGASSGQVVRTLLGQGVKMILAGVGIGALAAVFLARLMRGVLFGVSSSDPFAFGAGALILTVVGVLACYVPARRAARADPNISLRCD